MVGERLIGESSGARDERRRFFLRESRDLGILASVRNGQKQMPALKDTGLQGFARNTCG
jgi:hypothetical protein